MYLTHQPTLQHFAFRKPSTLVKTLTFVILSIQTPLYRIAKDMQSIRDFGLGSSVLWDRRAKAINYVTANASDLYAEAAEFSRLYARGFDVDQEVVSYFTEIPGIGLSKAGFIAQILFGRIGCIDIHNATRFGLTKQATRFEKTWPQSKQEMRIVDYIELCKDLGTAEELWDNWCKYVAVYSKFARVYKDAEHVSRTHLDFIDI